MIFREFLIAVEPGLDRYLSEFLIHKTIPETAHKKLLKRQREFLFVGGMPECVKTYRDTVSMVEAFQVQSEILESFLYFKT